MNPKVAKSVVIGATAGTSILSSLDALANGTAPNIRVGVGAVIAGSVLYAATDLAPELAASFALLMLAGGILLNGQTVFDIIQRATSA